MTLPNDGDNANASTVDNPFLAILALINGGLDNQNIAAGGLATANYADGSVTDVKLATSAAQAWKALSAPPNSVTALGNRSYSAVFNGLDLTPTLSVGQRVRFTRSVAAPTQCTNLNGTTQFYSKTAPNGMTFVNNFVVSAWVKLNSYGTGDLIIASRFNGTSGWSFGVTSVGQVVLRGYNAGAVNLSQVNSNQCIPLNKWVFLAAQLDMATFTATPTTSYVMVDGVDSPSVVTRIGTNPTALVQAGNLEIGSANGGNNPFPGKIAQVAIYSAKVSEVTILASMTQTLAGTESNLISAYSFNNSINDLNANANNLTANGAAVATTADSPFAQGATAGTLEYGIITGINFSTNTTLTVQVPEGSALPTAILAASFSSAKTPFGFPSQRTKWAILLIVNTLVSTSIASNGVWVPTTITFLEPAGEWYLGYEGSLSSSTTGAASVRSTFFTLANGTPTSSSYVQPLTSRLELSGALTTTIIQSLQKYFYDSVAAATLYSFYTTSDAVTTTELGLIRGDQGPLIISAELAYL